MDFIIFKCGGCSFKADSFSMLHIHLIQHNEGGNYFYQHAVKTAYPKYEYVSTETQTDEELKEVIKMETLPSVSEGEGSSEIMGRIEINPQCHTSGLQSELVPGLPRQHTALETGRNTFSEIVIKEEPSMDECTNPYFPETDDIDLYCYEDGSKIFSENCEFKIDSTADVNGFHAESCFDKSEPVIKTVPELRLKRKPKFVKETRRRLKRRRKTRKLAAAVQKMTAKDSDFCRSNPDCEPDDSSRKEEFTEDCDWDYNGENRTEQEEQTVEKKQCTLVKKCLLCHVTFVRNQNFSYHIESFHKNTYPLRCDQCSLTFVSVKEQTAHNCDMAAITNHLCSLCPQKRYWKWRDIIERHLEDCHNGELPHQCTVCRKQCVSDLDLKNHQVEHNPSNFMCPVCKKTFRSISRLEIHKPTHMISLVCEFCGKCYDEREKFRQHRHACRGKFECEECNRTFYSKAKLKSHMLIHLDLRPFICDKCGQSFRCQEGVESHIKYKHTFERNYKCSQCGKAFTCSATLTRHVKVHQKIRPYSCEFCDKKCSTKWNLKAHMRQHNGSRPYVCIHCGTGFAHNVARKTHEVKCEKAVHAGVTVTT